VTGPSLEQLVARRDELGVAITVCIPAFDEAATVGPVVQTVVTELSDRRGLVGEVLVVDDGSRDDTAHVAKRAGASVVVLPDNVGKGGAMAAGLSEATGDLVVFLDADVTNYSAHFVTQLVAPLLMEGPDGPIRLVKGYYTRYLGTSEGEGGRVTELTAKPLLYHLFPELRFVRQPLAGETAGWVVDLRTVGLDSGYRVEISLLLDFWRRFGAASIAQVDLGQRLHRNRPLAQLARQAQEIAGSILTRAGAPVWPEASDSDQAG
jgi:glucosyl-3-phosphoglycerate synthase